MSDDESRPHRDHGGSDPRLPELLDSQLDIAWRFATECVIPTIEPEDLLCQPGPNVCTVHDREGRWQADWPDESRLPLPEVTVAWLLWHIEWWWSDAAARVRGEAPIRPEDHGWSGGTAGIERAKADWDGLLTAVDLDRRIQWLLPDPVPVWRVAGWVPIELMKNLAEIHQLLVRRRNLSA